MIKNRLVSIVVPLHNESGNILVFLDRISAIAIANHSLEVIFVDDGSTDNTLIELKKNLNRDINIKFISLSRNYGHQTALKAGLDFANGDAVITMDGDLQHPPELIPKLILNWHNGYHIVTTLRKDIDETNLFKQITSDLFYKLMLKISAVRIIKGSADFRLLDRKVIIVLRSIKENPIFYRGMVDWVGFNTIGVAYTPEQRKWGESKYSLFKMLKFALLGLTSFTIKPLQLSVFVGILVAFISFLYGLYAIWIRVFTNEAIQGWASKIVVISFIGGIQLIMIGVLGEYLGKLFIEIKSRPPYIIRESSYEDK